MADKKTKKDETTEPEVAEEAAETQAVAEVEATDDAPEQEPEAVAEEIEAEEAEAPAAEEPAPAEVAAEAAAEEPAAEETQPEAAAEEPAAAAVAEDAVDETVGAGDEEAGVSPPAGGDTPDVPASEPKRKKKRLPRSLRPARTKRTRAGSGERKPIVRLPKPEGERGRRQERQGAVVSDAMEKTIVVEVQMIKAHPRYKKVVRRSVKFHAHDEQNQAKVGDIVRIVETRPLSATKRWRLVEIIEAAK